MVEVGVCQVGDGVLIFGDLDCSVRQKFDWKNHFISSCDRALDESFLRFV